MRWARRAIGRLRGVRGRAASDREIADELDAHLAMATDENIRRGMSPDDAQRAAIIAAGGLASATEAYRDQRGIPLIESIARDAVFALRSFRKTPGFAMTIIATLALSIGATTAMFSVVKSVLLDPLPFANSDRLMWTVNRGTRPYDSMSPADLADWGRSNDAFEQTGSWLATSVDMVGGGAPIHLSSADVTGNWFTMLGVRMALGRGLVSDDEDSGKPPVVVLSDALWRTQFGGDRHVVGTTVLLDGTRHTIVGVAPPSFRFPADVDVWRPVLPNASWATLRGSRIYRGPVALLRNGATFEQARRQARVIGARLHAEYPSAETGLDYDLQPLRDHLVGSSREVVVALFGAVAVLLLITCVNVATLLLVRATSRSGEIAVRLALGAGARRIAAQLLIESLLLSTMGAALGLGLAELLVRIIVARQVAAVPLLAGAHIDWRVFAFALLVTAVAGLAAGLAPAMHSARTDVARALRSGGRASSAGERALRARHALVALELVLVVPLLIGATLLARSFERLVNVDPGFRVDHIVRFNLTLPSCGTAWNPDSTCVGVVGARYMTPAAIEAFDETLMEQLRAIRGVRAVALAHGVPFTEWAFNQTTITIEGQPLPPPDRPNPVELKYATRGYFALLHVPVLAGRDFNDDDRFGSPRAVIVSAGAVKAYFNGASPIGQRIPGAGTVVGVVGDTRTQGLSGTVEPAVYLAMRQAPIPYITVLIASPVDLGSLMTAVRSQLASIDPSLPIFHPQLMADAVQESAASAQLAARVVGAFASVALLLAVIGIYGVVAYAVRERQRELGIRLALGARQVQVVRLVVRDTLPLAVVGVAVGGAVTVIGSRLLRGLLYGIAPTDPTTYTTSCVALAAIVIVAAWIPARRAARIDPLVAMRPE